jgi:hypothetical protein
MSPFRHLARMYAWFAIAGFAVVVAVVGAPVIWEIGFKLVGFIIAPIFIVWSVYKGDYVNAVLLSVFYALFLYVVLKNIDKILYALAWVRVVAGDLIGREARPSTVHSGGHDMSDDDSLERRRHVPLERISGNPIDTLVQTIKARLATKTTEEMTKAVQAKANLYTADTQLGQAMLTHDDTAVELEPNNREQRRENKQAELDIKAAEREIARREADRKLSEARAKDGKTPEQLDAELFERKRNIRSIDAQDDAFEDLGFASSKKHELGREYVKRKKEILKDRTLDDEVRDDLLLELKEDYKNALAKANQKARTQNASG